MKLLAYSLLLPTIEPTHLFPNILLLFPESTKVHILHVMSTFTSHKIYSVGVSSADLVDTRPPPGYEPYTIFGAEQRF